MKGDLRKTVNEKFDDTLDEITSRECNRSEETLPKQTELIGMKRPDGKKERQTLLASHLWTWERCKTETQQRRSPYGWSPWKSVKRLSSSFSKKNSLRVLIVSLIIQHPVNEEGRKHMVCSWTAMYERKHMSDFTHPINVCPLPYTDSTYSSMTTAEETTYM